MRTAIDRLGKVAVTVEKDYWSNKKTYDKLTIVEKQGIFGTYISRKAVPAGIDITNREYWIPFSSLKEEIVLKFNELISTVDEKESEIYNAISSIMVGGVALKQSLGNSEVFGISQKKITEEFADVRQKTAADDATLQAQITDNDTHIRNIADEEDVTMVSIDERPAIKLKDKTYEPEKYSGLGRKYLRKNIIYDANIVHFGGFVENVAIEPIGAAITDGNSSNVVYDRIRKSFLYREQKGSLAPAKYYDTWTSKEVPYSDYYQSSFSEGYTIRTDVVFMLGNLPYHWDENDQELAVGSDFYESHSKNILTQAMINEPNTIYHIQYDYDLNGQTITVPEGCTLEFNGGSLSDGTIIGQNTLILKDYVFNDIIFDGTFSNSELLIKEETFKGNIDFEGILHSFTYCRIELYKNVEQAEVTGDRRFKNINLHGNGFTVKVPYISNRDYVQPRLCEYVIIDNVNFDCSITTNTMIHVLGNYSSKVSITNCIFSNAKKSCVFLEDCYSPIIENNEISDALDESKAIEVLSVSQPFTITIYTCVGQIVCRNNYIHDINIGGILLTDAELHEDSKYLIEHNKITNIAGGGLKGWAHSIVHNATFIYNYIENTDCFNITEGITSPLTSFAAVNIHGYKNCIFSNNTIKNVLYGNCTDFEGRWVEQDESVTQNAGLGLVFTDNNIENANLIVFTNCRDTVIANNTIKEFSEIRFQAASNTIIKNNYFKQKAYNKDSSNNIIPPIRTYTSSIGNIENFEIFDNEIIGGNYAETFIKFQDGFATKIVIRNNKTCRTKGISAKNNLTYECTDALVPFIETADIVRHITLKKNTANIGWIYCNENDDYTYEEIKAITVLAGDTATWISPAAPKEISIIRKKQNVSDTVIANLSIGNVMNKRATADFVPSFRCNYVYYYSMGLQLGNDFVDEAVDVEVRMAPRDSRRFSAYHASGDPNVITVPVVLYTFLYIGCGVENPITSSSYQNKGHHSTPVGLYDITITESGQYIWMAVHKDIVMPYGMHANLRIGYVRFDLVGDSPIANYKLYRSRNTIDYDANNIDANNHILDVYGIANS